MKKFASLLILFLYSALLTPERVSAHTYNFSVNDILYFDLYNSPNDSQLGRKRKSDPDSLLNRGIESALIEINRLLALGDYDAFHEALLYCDEHYPNNDVINYTLSHYYCSDADYETALNYAIIADSLCNNNFWYVSLLAHIYYVMYNDSKAADYYAQSIELDPYSEICYKNAAACFALSHDYDRAFDYYTRYEEMFGLSSDVLSLKLELLSSCDYYVSRDSSKQLLKNEANFTLEKGTRPISDVVKIAQKLRIYDLDDEAEKFLNDYIERYDAGALYYAFAYFNYVTWNREKFEQYWNLGLLETEASSDDILYFTKKIYDSFHHDQVYVVLTNDLLERGNEIDVDLELMERFPEQQEVLTNAFERLKDTYPNADAIVMFYCDWLNLIGSPQYLSSLKDYLRQFTNEYYVYQEFLLKYTDKGDADTTLYYSLQCIENFPDKPLPYFSAAVAYIDKDDYDSALDILLAGVEEASDVSPLTGELYSLLGECYHERGENAKAYEAYDEALSFNPNDYQVLNNYAYYLSLDGINLEKAESMSYSVVRNDPNNAVYLDTYAWVLYCEGKFEEARVAMERALENMSEEESGLYYEHYGDILEALGEHDEALKNWRKALEFPDDIDTDSVKAKINGAGR